MRQSEPSVYRKIATGEIPAVRLGGGRSALRIPASELEAWLFAPAGGPSVHSTASRSAAESAAQGESSSPPPAQVAAAAWVRGAMLGGSFVVRLDDPLDALDVVGMNESRAISLSLALSRLRALEGKP